MRKRLALSIPVSDYTIAELPALAREAEAWGYSDAWTGESDSTDIFTPAAAVGLGTNMRVGTAIANVYTRGPATLAATAASFADLIPGRFILGLGSGSKIIIEKWNGGKFDKPLTRVREYATVIRQMMSGERVVYHGKTVKVDGYRITRPAPQPVPIHIAALREGMLKVAGEVGDGVILNWLGANDVPRVVAIAKNAAEDAGKNPDEFEVSARLFVHLDPQDSGPTDGMRRWITSYLNVPTYRAFQEWLGRGEDLGPMFEAWEANNRREALASIPQSTFDELFIAGTPQERRDHLQRYFDAGVDTAYLTFFTDETDPDRRREVIYRGVREMAGA